MPTARCPHCGATYDVDGLTTICSACLKALPRKGEATLVEEGADVGPPPVAPLTPAAPVPSPVMPPAPAVAPSGSPATVTPAALRRPCLKCGEPLYTTEPTCWKCGTHQTGPAVIPPEAVPVPGVPDAPAPPAYPPPPPPPLPYPHAGSTYPHGASPAAMNRANLSLILGIVGLALGIPSMFCCGALPSLVLGPIAVWLGTSARRDGAEGNATAGIVCGVIATILGLVGAAVFIVMIAAGMFASGASGSSPTP